MFCFASHETALFQKQPTTFNKGAANQRKLEYLRLQSFRDPVGIHDSREAVSYGLILRKVHLRCHPSVLPVDSRDTRHSTPRFPHSRLIAET